MKKRKLFGPAVDRAEKITGRGLLIPWLTTYESLHASIEAQAKSLGVHHKTITLWRKKLGFPKRREARNGRR